MKKQHSVRFGIVHYSEEMKDKTIAFIPVFIAGGGPAGSATALSLHARGIPCVVANASYKHAFKPGETVPANAMPLLRKLKLAHLLREPEHLACYGNRFLWGSDTVADENFMNRLHSQGWHLNRLVFEQQLQAECESKNITWYADCRIQQCIPVPNGWEVTLQHANGTVQTLQCGFIVDATGRASRISRSMGIDRKHFDHLSGICTHVTLSEPVQPQYTFIEATANGWWYAAPLPQNMLALAFMTDSNMLDQNLLNRDVFLQSAQSSQLVSGLLANVLPNIHPMLTQTASTAMLTQRHGPNWLAVGDAAYAYDPVSSYGIVSSLEGGYYAGHAIADTFLGAKEALPAYDWAISQAFEVYLKMHHTQYSYEQRFKESAFWLRRAFAPKPISI